MCNRRGSSVCVYFTLVTLVFSFLPGILNGQIPYSPKISEPFNESWRWRHMEKLSEKRVRCMTSDNDGNMWFGLDRGIMRYDGYNMEIFDDQPFLNFPVTSLIRDNEGRIFAGSDAGLLLFSNNQWEKVFPVDNSFRIPVTCISRKPDGSVLAGIQNGIVHFKDQDIHVFTVLSQVNFFRQIVPDSKISILPDEILLQRNFGRVDDIFVEDSGRIWVLMSRNNDGRLLRFHITDTLNRVLQKYTIKDDLGGFKLSHRNRILQRKNGEIWLINGFYKNGILKYDGRKWREIKLSDTFGGDELHTDIIELSDGSLMVGGQGKLFVNKNGNWLDFLSPAFPVPSSRIIIHESDNGQIWIAGMQGDVFRLNPRLDQWIRYIGMNYQCRDEEGREWFISVNGEVVYSDNQKWYAYDRQHGLIDAPVKLISTRKGRIWAAGSHQGIAATAYLENGKWKKQIHRELSWGIDARSVFQDREGSLWFGASVDRQESLGQVSGVLKLIDPDSDSLEWHHHTQFEGITQHNVYGIGQSPDGAMWLGGTNLLHLTGRRWNPASGNELLNEYVDIVHSGENLWVGSRFYGLFRFDGERWTQYTKSHGLPNNTIIGIFEESPENVWVITDKDIAWFDGKNWFSGLFPEAFRISREGGDISVDRDGAVWINKSLREWKRRAFPFSITPATAMEEFWTICYSRGSMPPMTTIQVYTEKVDPSGNTLISWAGKDFWEQTPTSGLTYSWRLNDNEWSEFSSATSKVFTNLRSGKYTFEVRSRNLDHNIDQEPAIIYFSVRHPVWKQPWFIVLVISFLVVIGLYEARVWNRNRKLSRLNASLNEVNIALENRRIKIENQKEKILSQKKELEKKTVILEDQNAEIIRQRDKLKEMVEKVEELSRIKQRFFTNISHEFRTPLTLILGSIERLLSYPHGMEKNGLNKAYETIRNNSRRILRLINQILEIRKIETETLELMPSKGDIVSFTKEIVFLFHDLARNQSVGLSFRSAERRLTAMFDHDKIEKILSNLLSNAFKATQAGGSISVTLQLIPSLPGSTGSGMLVFAVQDTGKGISEQHINHIFERFYKVDDSFSYKESGTSGIGLSFAKDLALIHNGNITVESKPGQGSTFYFEMPYVRGEEETGSESGDFFMQTVPELPKERKSSTEKEKIKPIILIVEDEPELREFIHGTLESDYEIVEARHGLEGYNQALSYQPDIIITDIMMPEMGGNELCNILKDNPATNHIPVIMLTARTSPESKMQGYQTGADAYIEKPFSTEFLRIRIRNLLQARVKMRDKLLRELITQPSDLEVHSENEKMVRKIREILEENISDSGFDVLSMSRHFNLSRFHFTRKIKQLTGLSPKEIIDSFRLKRAGQLLQQQKLSVNEIAYMVGFDHPNSFSRAFRKHFNMTPTEYSTQPDEAK